MPKLYEKRYGQETYKSKNKEFSYLFEPSYVNINRKTNK